VELDLFKFFVAAAEARSFKRAAQLLHVSQPTLSRQIARLERELGVQLFERYGRHVECTASGEFLLPLARALIASTETTIRLVREQVGDGPSSVRLGATGMTLAHLLTPILATFIAAHPSVKLDLIEREDDRLEEAVISGELDCAVITSWGHTRAASKHLFSEEILLVVPRNHPLASRTVVSLKMLEHESIVLPTERMNTSRVLADAFSRAGFEPRFTLRANYPELLKKLAQMGFGVTLLPSMLVTPNTLEGAVAISLEERVVRDLALIYSWDRPLPVAARALMAHIQKQALLLTTTSHKHREPGDRSRRLKRATDATSGLPIP
jgi:DNA-binding transcriptional LysR family regulator